VDEPGTARGAGPDRLAHLRWGLAVALPLLVVGAGVAGLAGGSVAAVGFSAGTGVVIASFAVSSLVIALADRLDPALVLPFGIGAYVTKFSLIVLLLTVLGDGGWRGRVPMGTGMVVTALCWSAAQVTWVVLRGPQARRAGGAGGA
jgi:hypothetical protein